MLETCSKKCAGLALATLFSLGAATAALAAPFPVPSAATKTGASVVRVIYHGHHGYHGRYGHHGYGHHVYRRNYYNRGAAGAGLGAAGLALGAVGGAAAVATGGYGPYGNGYYRGY